METDIYLPDLQIVNPEIYAQLSYLIIFGNELSPLRNVEYCFIDDMPTRDAHTNAVDELMSRFMF